MLVEGLQPPFPLNLHPALALRRPPIPAPPPAWFPAQFNFLKPTHSLFAFFTSLADAYSRVMMPDKGLRGKLAKDVEDRWGGFVGVPGAGAGAGAGEGAGGALRHA